MLLRCLFFLKFLPNIPHENCQLYFLFILSISSLPPDLFSFWISSTLSLFKEPSPLLFSASLSCNPVHPTLNSLQKVCVLDTTFAPPDPISPFAHCLCPGRPMLPSGSWLGTTKPGGWGKKEVGVSAPSPQGFSSSLVALSSATILPAGYGNHQAPTPPGRAPLQVIITPTPLASLNWHP